MYFFEKHMSRSGKKLEGFNNKAMNMLKGYSFPGNVRELENIVERAIIIEQSPLITPESLPATMQLFKIETLRSDKVKTLDEVSRDYTQRVLEVAGGNKSKAAELLGISRTSLWRILKEK
jgi:transcriptional regulator with PAS, ATPase and Fis domain